MLFVKKELNFEDLKNECWSGAIHTLNRIEEEGKEEDLMDLLEEVFFNKVPEITTLNDFLWFDDNFIYESLGIEVEE